MKSYAVISLMVLFFCGLTACSTQMSQEAPAPQATSPSPEAQGGATAQGTQNPSGQQEINVKNPQESTGQRPANQSSGGSNAARIINPLMP